MRISRGDFAYERRGRTDMQEGGDIAHGRGRRSETHAGDAESVVAYLGLPWPT